MTAPDDPTHIVKMLLRVARLGEADCHGWWATHSFGAAGRVVLGQRLPRTWRMAAIELDIAAAANRHNDIIDRPSAVHLFSDNWPVRRWASAWVSEQKTATDPDVFFEELETASTEWLVAGLGTPPKGLDPTARAARIGSIERGELSAFSAVDAAADGLASAYAALDGTFAVPYLEVMP